MKITILFIIFAAFKSSSAQVPELPTCAALCDEESVGSSTCDDTDYKCLCTNVNYITVNSECIEKSCDEADISSALTHAIYICSLYGVAITSYLTDASITAAEATTVNDITSVTVAPVATTIQVTNSPGSTIPSPGGETPVGPIVGGVVGGVAVLCLIVGAIYFFFFRRRNPGKQKDHEQVPTQDHAEKRDEPVDPDPVQTPSVDPRTAPLDDILSGRLRYTDPDQFAAPQDHQDGGDLPSGRLQYPNVE